MAQNGRKNQKIRKKAPRRRPTPIATSRTEAKEGGGGVGEPRLGGLGGSDRKGERFGGSEEKKRALPADPVVGGFNSPACVPPHCGTSAGELNWVVEMNRIVELGCRIEHDWGIPIGHPGINT